MHERSDVHQHQQHQRRQATMEPMVIEVQIRRPQHDTPLYTWDAQHSCLRLTAIYHAETGVPATLAVLHVSERLELPVLLLTPFGIPPGTVVQAYVLGALWLNRHTAPSSEEAMPASGRVFIASVQDETAPAQPHSLTLLPPAQIEALQTYVRTQPQYGSFQTDGIVEVGDADTAARLLRETRFLLKRQQRTQPAKTAWFGHEGGEQPVAWRAIEGLSETMRLRVQHDAALAHDTLAPHAQAVYLIRFVPQRFQHALTRLLLDDERLLVFMERPLLRHRTGWLRTQTWRANEGLLLVTDRHILWLRDFLAPGNAFLEGGYIAHMAPLERLQAAVVLPPGKTSAGFAGRLEEEASPYQRLVMQIACATGEEFFVVDFPTAAEANQALKHITGLLHSFVPFVNGEADRRLRRVPHVDPWIPQGAEAEKLAGLGGIVAAPIAQRLEGELMEFQQASHEEVLVSVVIPALEDYKSPARLIALTRTALLVIEDRQGKNRSASRITEHPMQVHRYDLTTISSAQLRYSLLGSSLSIFVPQSQRQTQKITFPFHSPAIAWFLPLFTRLRLLLSGPFSINDRQS